MPVCLSVCFLFVTVHPKKVRRSDEGSSTPSVPPGVQKITLWQRIRHCLKQRLNYFNKTRACFYFDLVRSYCVPIHLFSLCFWIGLRLLSLILKVIGDYFLSEYQFTHFSLNLIFFTLLISLILLFMAETHSVAAGFEIGDKFLPIISEKQKWSWMKFIQSDLELLYMSEVARLWSN